MTEPRTVLLVDDDDDARAVTGACLAAEGYRVVDAKDGAEALALLDGGLRPAVILLDLHMPNIDGWEFRRRQLEDAALADIPVAVVSAASPSLHFQKQFFRGTHRLRKPPTTDELLGLMLAVIG
jgi:CheY-like chemotaxis protein